MPYLMPVALTAALLLAAPVRAGETTISFDEFAAPNNILETLSEEYAHLGAHFVTDDDGSIWGGMSAGDPGRWGLEGSEGPAFLGFDGASYVATVVFDERVWGVELDVARANGSRAGDSFQLVGMRSGLVVESVNTKLGPVGQWTTVALSSKVDTLILVGKGAIRGEPHPFGIDRLHWIARDRTLQVEIDVRPRSERNRIRLRGRGVVPVALLGSEALDVTQVDPTSLVFGPEEAPIAHRRGPHLVDVNGDEWLDLVSHHRIRATGLSPLDTQACLRGTTLDGRPFEGCDDVRVVPGRAGCRPGRGRGAR